MFSFSTRSSVYGSVAVALGSIEASAQFPLSGAGGLAADGRFGFVLVTCGDLNDDGRVDFAVGSPTGAGDRPDQPASAFLAGRVRAVDAEGATIIEWLGTQPGDAFGYAIAAIGDVDLDGVPDLAVGAPRASSEFDLFTGRVAVFSAKTGALLWQVFGSAPHDYNGAAVSQLGDLNQDGRPDFLVGTPFADANGKDSGRARIHVGHNGSVLKTHNGAATLDLLGFALCALEDTTGDGLPDYAIGAPNALLIAGFRGGRATLHSAAGPSLGKLEGLADGDATGSALGSIDDVNGDGRRDVLVGEPGASGQFAGMGRVRCISSLAGTVITTTMGLAAAERFGTRVAGLTDFDLDDTPDWLAATESTGGSLHSGATGSPLISSLPTTRIRGMASIVDLDEDGIHDFVLGFPLADVGPQLAAGRVEFWPGPAAVPAIRFVNQSPIEVATTPGAAKFTVHRSVVGASLAQTTATASAEPSVGWISAVHAPAKPLAYGDVSQVEIEIDPTALPGPKAESTLVLAAAQSSIEGTCSVVVTAPSPGGLPQIAVDKVGPLIAAQEAAGPAPQPFVVRVSNIGNQDYALTFDVLFDPAIPWATATPAFGVIAANEADPIEIHVALDAGRALGPLVTNLVVRDLASGDRVAVPVALLSGDPRFVPGDSLHGVLAADDDVDVALFEGIAGMSIELTVQDAPVGMTIAWLDYDGNAVATYQPKAGKNWKKLVLVERDGPWRIAVSGLAGTLYEIRTRRKKLPKIAKSRELTVTGAILDPPGLDVACLPGAIVDIVAKSKPSVIAVVSPRLTLATGAEFDVSAFATATAGQVGVFGVPIQTAGTQRFEYLGLPAGKSLTVDIAVKQPPKGKEVIEID